MNEHSKAQRISPAWTKPKRATDLTIVDWCYLAVASVELLAARIRLFVTPTAKILQGLGAPSSVPQRRGRPVTKAHLERFSWAIAAAASRVPWRSDCLVQVIAADQWLRCRRVPSEFYLGVCKNTYGEFRAHAWIRCGDLTITGGRFDQFSVLIQTTKAT
jgi:hypothetical protein